MGSADNRIEDNDFAFSENFAFYLYKGNDAPKPGDDGRPKKNWFANNRAPDNASSGISLNGADDNTFTANLFSGNFGPLWFVNARRNLLESNSIPSEVTVETQGDPHFPSITSIRNQPSLSIRVDGYSSTIFEDLKGRVFDPGADGVWTTLTPARTTLALTAAESAKASTVSTRNFQAVPDAGLALVSISIWNISGDLGKRWLLQAGSATHTISFKVGDLAPNQTYNLLKNGAASRLTSDGAGWVTFQDKAVTTGLAEYIVSR